MDLRRPGPYGRPGTCREPRSSLKGDPDRALQCPDVGHERDRRTLVRDADVNISTAPSSGMRSFCGGSCASTRPITITTGLAGC
jgi:hypothetical protein